MNSSNRRTATALLVAAVFFMENLDATVITTALPAMAAQFGTAPAHLSVGVSAYLVALTVFIPVSLLTAEIPRWLVAALLFFSGMARSMQFTALNTIGFADVPQARMRDASTLFSVLQQMNAGMGIAVGALALSIAARAQVARLKRADKPQ